MATGRFAPSPTGALHLGSLRTAHAGVAVRPLGREPVPAAGRGPRPGDQLRASTRPGSSPTSRALGLDWDGPVVRQSERRDAHEAALAELVERGLTYPCFCSRREIREASAAPHAPPGRVSRARAATSRPREVAAAGGRGSAGGAAAARRRRAGHDRRPAARRGHPAGRRHRAAPQRRRARLPRGRRRRRRRPGRGGGGARRRPPRGHARARPTCSTCSACPARRGRTSRWCSVPTASASPSATAPSRLADLAADGRRTPTRSAAAWRPASAWPSQASR